MPRFSANLGFLWTDLPLLDRIAAAAAAGFRAVELHWSYDVPAGLVKQACEKHGMELLGINTPVGDAARGDFGLGALPGRQSDSAKSFHQAADYARRSGASSVHVMAGVVEPEASRKPRKSSHAISPSRQLPSRI
jgi:hydroxypyruvate isomerase